MLTGNNLCLEKRKFKILENVDVEVRKGEILVIIGPNGAGKSSLLSLMANEQTATEDDIQFKSKKYQEWDILELAHQKAKFSQENNSGIGLSVCEIVLMGRYPYFDSKPKQQDIAFVEEAMKKTETFDLKDRAYNSLSGGEKQRVHLARVLVQLENKLNEKLIFLDEPLNNLDVRHQHHILKEIQKFVKEGNSAVLVLHDLNLTAEFADRVLLLKKGKTVACGEVHSIFKSEIISEAFDYPCQIFKNPVNSLPMVVFGKN